MTQVFVAHEVANPRGWRERCRRCRRLTQEFPLGQYVGAANQLWRTHLMLAATRAGIAHVGFINGAY